MKRGTSLLPQRLRTRQNSTHQAFVRVVVHSRRSEIETNSWAMDITLRAFVPGSDAPQPESCVGRKPGLSRAHTAGAGLNPKKDCGLWGSALGVRAALSARVPGYPVFCCSYAHSFGAGSRDWEEAEHSGSHESRG